jgi:SAM-dependent methyltransferase
MRAAALSVAIVLLSLPAYAQDPAKPFVPVEGQAGKDVVWVPSPPDMVDKMMELAKVTPADLVMDLGSGDGRNIIAAAKRGAHGIGVEYNPNMVTLSRRLAADAGVADKAQFVEADMYTYDISKANVLALFLLPTNMNRLAPKFFNLAPGSRIVANTFGIEGWQPDYRETLPANSECDSWCEVLLWIVPAKVQGTWTTATGSMVLTQDYQNVSGTLTDGRRTQPITGKLRGEEITLTAGGVTYKGIVKGSTIEGTATSPTTTTQFLATRR